MPTAYIHQPGSRVRLVSERLEVHGRDEETGRDGLLREIPIRDLDRLILREGTQISSEALAALLRADVPVSIMGWNGRFIGAFNPPLNAHGLWRLRHYQLALDLMEPFRSVLVEALALDLFSHGMLGAGDFEPHEGGIYLADSGRRTYLLQYERRMERQFLSEHAGHRTTLRAQLEAQGTTFKAALEVPKKFEPFLMN